MLSRQVKPENAQCTQLLLVVDDDAEILKQLDWALSAEYKVLAAGDRQSALSIYRVERPPVVLLDLGLPPRPRDASEGLQALDELLTLDPLVKVIIVSGNSEHENALLAVERGAFDIFPKPVDMEELKVVLRRVFQRDALEREAAEAQRRAATFCFEDIVGSGPQMRAILHTVRKVAVTEVPLLITGESGTGKELLATAVHNLSPRKPGPFVAINCAAIPENLLESELFGHEKGAFTGANVQRKGRLEYAGGGTLFLDEIGELAAMLQVKILRFLQEKVIERVGGRQAIPVDGRVIAATNQDIEKAVKEGHFREDLYFRLAVVTIHIPPLRERGDDVVALAQHFVDLYSREQKLPARRLTHQALVAIRSHPWPGNVRELQNRIKRAVVLADGPGIGPGDLELETPANGTVATGITLREARAQLEKDLVAKALRDCQGNISKAARTLGISRPTLYDLMLKYGIPAT